MLRELLNQVREALERNGQDGPARLVREATLASEQQLRAFLESNDLWGGSGSIAEQAGVELPRAARAEIEAALITLGDAQIALHVVNSRTSMWVEAFREWQRRAI